MFNKSKLKKFIADGRKYLDLLDDYTKYRYTQHSAVAPIYIWGGECGGDLLGLILPIRIGEPAGYQVVRS